MRLANEQLWEVSAHLDLVLDSLTDHAVLTLDINGYVTSWNHGAQRTKGYEASEIIGRHFRCFFSKADQDADIPMRALRLARDLGKHESEGWRLRHDGSRFWAQTIIHPLSDGAGNLRGFVKVTRDVTQRVQVEKLRDELSQSKSTRWLAS